MFSHWIQTRLLVSSNGGSLKYPFTNPCQLSEIRSLSGPPFFPGRSLGGLRLLRTVPDLSRLETPLVFQWVSGQLLVSSDFALHRTLRRRLSPRIIFQKYSQNSEHVPLSGNHVCLWPPNFRKRVAKLKDNCPSPGATLCWKGGSVD